MVVSVTRLAIKQRRHSEWVDMYRAGISRQDIASLCSRSLVSVPQVLNRATVLDPTIEADYQKNAKVDRQITPEDAKWERRFRELVRFVDEHHRFPTPSTVNSVEVSLARWVAEQRCLTSEGSLAELKSKLLDVAGNWRESPRTRAERARWHHRLKLLTAFIEEEGLWPRWKHPLPAKEHLVGVWLHFQRQQSSRGTLSPERRDLLNQWVPGWDADKRSTTRAVRSPGRSLKRDGFNSSSYWLSTQ